MTYLPPSVWPTTGTLARVRDSPPAPQATPENKNGRRLTPTTVFPTTFTTPPKSPQKPSGRVEAREGPAAVLRYGEEPDRRIGPPATVYEVTSSPCRACRRGSA